MYYAHISHRSLLSLSGEDCLPFLQGLITNNALTLEKGKPIYAALLTPQGKFLHDFFIYPHGKKFIIDCERTRMDDLRKRLTLYKLRSKVTIEVLDQAVIALWGGNTAPQNAFADPRLPQLGFRMIGNKDELLAWCMQQGWQHVDATAYDRMRLELAVPEGSRDLEIDRAIILHYGFEDLHGVDFTKGCYVGQEVIARTKYRGHLKKFLYSVQAQNGSLPASGTAIHFGDAESGSVLSVEGGIGLAVLRVEDVEKSHATNTPFRAGDTALFAALPEWVTVKPLSAAGE